MLCTPSLSVYADEKNSEHFLEEVIVTATKRGESIQDVPIAITAVSGESLKNNGVFDFRDLNQVASSLNITTTASAASTTVRIRGIGTAGLNPGFESAVGVFVDGVYRSRSGHALSDLTDINRIEVLRGPQGTLFGKNTSAGVVSVFTNRPEYEFGGGLRASVGNRNSVRVDGHLTGGLVEDKLAYRLSMSSNSADGYIEDIVSGDEYVDRDRWAVKGQFLWDITDYLSMHLIADYRETDEQCCVAVYQVVGPIGPLLSSLGAYQPTENYTEGDRKGAYNSAPFEKVTDSGVSIELNWETYIGTVTSITSERSNKVDRAVDPDHSDADILGPLAEAEDFETFSQELRVSGDIGNIDWLVGAYYFDEKLDRSGELVFGEDAGTIISVLSPFGELASQFPAGQGAFEESEQEGDGWALFTHNIFGLTDQVQLVAGLRYSSEKKKAAVTINDAPIGSYINDSHCSTSFAYYVLDVTCNNFSWKESKSEDATTGTLAIRYSLNDFSSVYASYSRGFKSGGFNLDRQAVQEVRGELADGSEFGSEQADSYELGAKSEFLDGRARLNAAIFYTDFEGYQQFNYTGIRFFVDNIDEVISKGIEVEGAFVVNKSIELSMGVTYADTRYGSDLDAISGVSPGERITNAPRWQGNLGFSLEHELSPKVRGLLYVNSYFQGPTYLRRGEQDESVQDFYAVVNAQAGFNVANGNIRVMLWAKNLFDRDYNISVFSSALQSGSLSAYVSEPRSYGASIDYKF